MDFLMSMLETGTTALSYIIPFLFVLTLVVFVHELGHFWVARRCGVAIDAFSIGFGRALWQRTDRLGTVWKIGWLPLGGYVKFRGDENAASMPDVAELERLSEAEREGAYHLKPVGQRAAIAAAGPLANFLLAIAIFTLLFTLVGRPVASPRVDQVQPGSAAEAAGLEPGDLITEIDGRKIKTFSDFQRLISTSADVTLSITVDRGGEPVTLTATPRRQEIKDRFGGVHKIGLLGISRTAQPGDDQFVRTNPLESMILACQETWFVVDRTMSYLSRMVMGLESADQLSGPIRIAQVSGQAAEVGILSLISLAAVLSISIGLINLFPIPMLDGGHLLFYAFEAIRGRPLTDGVQEVGFRIGLAAVVTLMLFATWNDLVHVGLFKFISGFFS